ncbi:hypothetical protein Snoj_27710 [Streptomyces nojiriensis]|uniref:DUF4232 domain-containing protein n=1 Tax=Streptomyces nojiriensis TaxID=66374 RepID=A0ABQ3SL37_9ACTN|nr:DUF4232 domain-containing protein [Streptomyces nojiriensis]QTI42452.1 hypothetical protein JYK04_00210 [Streptomyces nojiriensis]GGS40038.1 hypothetical protein GCM10010205_82030 [Streptomyces nojiriensis]GHI68853.1 hypothetical protein Snoj_27710 [Streptomyces nojiriensis]
MRIHPSRAAALATAVGFVLALTGCGGGTDGDLKAPTAGTGTSAASGTPAASGTASATPTAAGPSGTGDPAGAAGPTPTGPDGNGKATYSADATTEDAYAYTHPCSASNLTVKVTSPQGFPATVRVVTVTNNGSTTCGLDFHPAVGFSAKGSALGIQATPPEGLGGAPAHPVRPGATTYAAVDLNPSGGGGPVADEINILADPSHMPNADGVSLPLATTGTVAKPRVGLYHFTARDSFDTL